MNQDNGGIIGKINTPTTSVASGVWSLQDQFESQSSSIWPLGFPQTTFTNSCRFDDASSDSLSHTQSTPTNADKITFSFWVKLAELLAGGSDRAIIGERTDANNQSYLYFRNDQTLGFYQVQSGSANFDFRSARVFTDNSAWYNIVVAFDTAQSTNTDRFKLYVNSEEITTWNANTYPSQNDNVRLNGGGEVLRIGGGLSVTDCSLYLAEFVYVDGQALTPTSFGATNPVTNIWEPIAYTGTYGTNGFKLNFSDSSNLGDDTSGNGNDFTVNNLTSVDQSTDTPSNNFAVGNILDNGADKSPVFLNGNISYSVGSAVWRYATSTIGVSSGKWYMEQKIGSYSFAGVTDLYHITANSYADSDSFVGSEALSVGYYSQDGNKYTSNSASSYGDTFTTNDIIGIALDMDNGYVYFSKNGTFQNSGDPTSGSTGTGGIALPTSSNSTGTFLFMPSLYNGTMDVNYGSPAYSISSGNADANGHGNFEYAVPSGYFALCTKNLAEFG